MNSQAISKGIIAAAALLAVAFSNVPAAAAAAKNKLPTIRGVPASRVTTGQAYSFRPSASDPEGRKLTFSIYNKPTWASFSRTSGKLSGTPASASVGKYIGIRIRVSDGHSTASLAPFSVTVNQVNVAPSVAGTPATAAREGQVYEFKPVATDADGDTLTFSIANKPNWSTFDSATGILQGTPGIGTVGSYPNIAIRVSDGTRTATLPTFAIGVEQASTGSVTLSWQAPTLRTDGSPLLNLAGYRVRYGTVSGSYPNEVQIANAGVTSHVLTNLPAGTYYFVATAYDSDGGESEFSGIASKTIT